jgi:hypothetical protein
LPPWYLGETDTQSGLEWIATLDNLAALKPKAVVAGHKLPQNDDDPRIIAEMQQYLRDFNRLNAATVDVRQLYGPCGSVRYRRRLHTSPAAVHLPLTDHQNGCRRCDRPPTCENIGQHSGPLQIACAHRHPAHLTLLTSFYKLAIQEMRTREAV